MIQLEIATLLLLRSRQFNHFGPSLALQQGGCIADNKEEMSGSRDRHIQPSRVGEETERGLLRRHCVRSDAVENHDVFLSTLERIHGVYLNITQLTVDLAEPNSKGILQVLYLRLVWTNHSNLAS